jgi:hypothetical protein
MIGPHFHEQVPERVVHPGRSQAQSLVGVPPTVRRLVGGREQGDLHVFALSCRRQNVPLAPMASVGRVLLQQELPLFAPFGAVQGGVRL